MDRLATQNDMVYIFGVLNVKLSKVLFAFFFILCYLFLKGTVDLEREEGEECEENMEVFDDSSSSPSGTLRNYPLTCKVLYSYKVKAHTKAQTRVPFGDHLHHFSHHVQF